MNWLARRTAARRRGVGKYDTGEARVYGETQGLGWLTADEASAYFADLNRRDVLDPATPARCPTHRARALSVDARHPAVEV